MHGSHWNRRSVCSTSHLVAANPLAQLVFFPPQPVFFLARKESTPTNLIMSLKRINKELLDLGRYVILGAGAPAFSLNWPLATF